MSRPFGPTSVALKPESLAAIGPALLSSTHVSISMVEGRGSISVALMMVIVVAFTNMLTTMGTITSRMIGTNMMSPSSTIVPQPSIARHGVPQKKVHCRCSHDGRARGGSPKALPDSTMDWERSMLWCWLWREPRAAEERAGSLSEKSEAMAARFGGRVRWSRQRKVAAVSKDA